MAVEVFRRKADLNDYNCKQGGRLTENDCAYRIIRLSDLVSPPQAPWPATVELGSQKPKIAATRAEALPRDGAGRLASGAGFPPAVEDLLQTGLELRDRYKQGEISERGMGIATGKLEAKLDRMLETHRRNPANQRLARHLEHEQHWLFTFLHCFGWDASNNAAERTIRGMVIARRVWGGSRTWEGARTHQVLASVLRTCWQQGKDVFTRCVRLLRAPRNVMLDIVPGRTEPRHSQMHA